MSRFFRTEIVHSDDGWGIPQTRKSATARRHNSAPAIREDRNPSKPR